MSKLSINLIVYSKSEAKYLPFLFDSLNKQTFQDWQMILVDNKSDGNVVEVAEEELKKIGREYKVIKNDDNIGFASAHNQAYKEANTEYILLLNPDMYLLPDTLEKMVSFLDKHKQVSTVSTRLMQWRFEELNADPRGSSTQIDTQKLEHSFTNDIDAIGIRLFRNRRAVDWLSRYTWEENSESADVRKLFGKSVAEVFGVSGAFAMMRKEQIDKVVLPGDCLFDPTYHSYKEDLDLAYRMRNAGYTSYVLLDTCAYHDRTGAGPKKMGDWAALKNKKNHSPYIRLHSYKNHLRTLYKNEYWQNLYTDLPFILWYELKKFCFLLLTSPKAVLGGWVGIIKDFGYTRKTRKSILKTRTMYWKGLRRWF
jgi:GT2 family glycosyltransferase